MATFRRSDKKASRITPLQKVLFFGIIIVGVVLGYLHERKVTSPSTSTIQSPIFVKTCASDTMVCPNGLVVGREGERCEFATCPNIKVQTNPDPKAQALQYEDRYHRFRFSYPQSFTQNVENQGNTIRLAQVKASDKKGTVVTDGVLISIEPIILSGQTLEQWTDTFIKQLEDTQKAKITTNKTAVTQKNAKGFTFTADEGEIFVHTMLQKSTSSSFAVHFTIQVVDPKNQGYQQQVDQILASLELVQ